MIQGLGFGCDSGFRVWGFQVKLKDMTLRVVFLAQGLLL